MGILYSSHLSFHYPTLKPKHRKRLLANGISGSPAHGFGSTWADFARQCTIRSGSSFVPFDPYQYQLEIVQLIESRRFIIICKTRQMGLSELVCNYFLWKALSDPAFCGVVFSKTQADTSNLAKRIKRSIFDFIATDRIHLEPANLTDISILGGDRLMFMNSSPAGVRGAELVSHVLLDEHAFSESPQQIFDAMLPTLEMVGESSRVILCSTPNSQGKRI